MLGTRYHRAAIGSHIVTYNVRTTTNATHPKNPAKTTRDGSSTSKKKGYSMQYYRVWLRLESGGIMGLPYPAKSEERAAELADIAAAIWRGTVVYLETMVPE